jgi:lysozyme family protein
MGVKIPISDLAMQIIKEGTAIEAGYVNHASDLGKATNHGITEATAKEHSDLWPLYNFNGDMRELPIDLAYHIYYNSWWRRLMLDRLAIYSVPLTKLMFDFGINAGRKNAVKALQKILNVHNRKALLYKDLETDGYMGGKTLDALVGYLDAPYSDQLEKLLFHVHALRDTHYIDIALAREANEDFSNGWSDRAYQHAKHDAPVMFK